MQLDQEGCFLHHTVNCVLNIILAGRIMNTQKNQYIFMGGVPSVGSLALPERRLVGNLSNGGGAMFTDSGLCTVLFPSMT